MVEQTDHRKCGTNARTNSLGCCMGTHAIVEQNTFLESIMQTHQFISFLWDY